MKKIFDKYKKDFSEQDIKVLKILNKPLTTWKENNPKSSDEMDLTNPTNLIDLRKDIIEFIPELKDTFDLILEKLKRENLVDKDNEFLNGSIKRTDKELHEYETDHTDGIQSPKLLTDCGKKFLKFIEEEKKE